MAETASTLSDLSGIAASTIRAAWDRAYHEYERLSLLRDAYEQIGPLAEVNGEYDDKRQGIASRYGSETCPAAREEIHSLHLDYEGRLHEASMRFGEYIDKADAALYDLIRAPSPDIAAARTKIDIVKWQYAEDGVFSEEIWQAIEADLRRMGQMNA